MHVRKVLEIMRTHKHFVEKSKCTFLVDRVEYLGFVVSKDGISTDLAKVQVVRLIGLNLDQ